MPAGPLYCLEGMDQWNATQALYGNRRERPSHSRYLCHPLGVCTHYTTTKVFTVSKPACGREEGETKQNVCIRKFFYTENDRRKRQKREQFTAKRKE